MTERMDFETRLATAFVSYADRAPVEVDAVSMTAVVAQGTRRRWSFALSRTAWLVFGTALALLALGAAILVGAYLLQPRIVLGGGALMIIAQASQPNDDPAAQATSIHVFAFDAATGTRAPILDLPITADSSSGPATWAKWSPDRTHALLFDLDGDFGGIVDVASHSLRGIARSAVDPVGDYQMTWGPASDRIASLGGDTEGRSFVLIFDLKGAEVSRLALPASSIGEPSWSPDGSAILLAGCLPCSNGYQDVPSTAIGHGHLFVLPIDGAPMRTLLDTSAEYVWNAVWSPDGTAIAYASSTGISTVVVATGRETALTQGTDGRPTWSPDGRRIAFTRQDDHVPPQPGDADRKGIYVIDADGTHLSRLSDGPDVNPDWSPDGNSVLFGREDMDVGFPSVWAVAADGGEPRLLFKNATADTGSGVAP